MNKIFTLFALAAAAMTANAQKAYEIGVPNNSNYDYLKEYHPLKDYIDYSKYPNFKLGIGTTVSDYLNNSTFKGMINDNFTETVAGNAMKMASCVDNNGNMNFNTVTNYVNAATNAGLNVYGHTLAWHSQQPNGWLRGLIKDKAPVPFENPDTMVHQVCSSKDFRTQQNIGWHSDYSQYNYNVTFNSTDGMKATVTKKASQNYEVQYWAMSDINAEAGKKYKMIMTIKGSAAGSTYARIGDWGGGPNKTISFTTEWKDVEWDFTNTVANPGILLQHGSFVGDIYIKEIKIMETVGAMKVNDERRFVKVEATAKKAEAWDNQFWVLSSTSFTSGQSYVFTADIRADKPARVSTQIHTDPGTYVTYEALGDLNFTTEWKTVNISGNFKGSGKSIAFNLNELADANTYYFDNISLKIGGTEKVTNGAITSDVLTSFKMKVDGGAVVAPKIGESDFYLQMPQSTPRTKEEKCTILQGAMEKWIKGMMTACKGKVKAWDVVNEAISGGGNDGSGFYTLQHSDGFNGDATWDVGGDAFFWQDHMGDLEYVRSAVKYARQYGPEDIKLFINDYNLESDWDGNKKLKSLINWIKKWEADGVTKIDGIGTQMHISFYKNSGTQQSKKNAITNMFKLMAASGKLVRVSEMDMGYVDANNKDVPTANMTEAQHKEMADYYEWIIKEFFRLVPPEQQWGICQWCPTDSPTNSGWRANTPVGIWDLSYHRKHVYAGFVRGLGGEVYTSVENAEADTVVEKDATIRNIMGVKQTSAFEDLPMGIYIVNGKKVAKTK